MNIFKKLFNGLSSEKPYCEIDDSGTTISSRTEYVDGRKVCRFGGTIYGKAGSTAQAYAEKYGCRFECL